MADFPELTFQVLLVLMAVAWLAFGGDKFESSYGPSRRWLLGANWFKRGLTNKKGYHTIKVN